MIPPSLNLIASLANFFYRRTARGTGSYYPGGEGAMFLQAVKRLMGNQEDTVYYCPVDGVTFSALLYTKIIRSSSVPSTLKLSLLLSRTGAFSVQ